MVVHSRKNKVVESIRSIVNTVDDGDNTEKKNLQPYLREQLHLSYVNELRVRQFKKVSLQLSFKTVNRVN